MQICVVSMSKRQVADFDFPRSGKDINGLLEIGTQHRVSLSRAEDPAMSARYPVSASVVGTKKKKI